MTIFVGGTKEWTILKLLQTIISQFAEKVKPDVRGNRPGVMATDD
jgi:hypothetical protein